MILNFRYIFDSQKGTKRVLNKDKVQIIENDLFFLFCLYDGVSSEQNSHIFINHFINFINKNYLKFVKKNSLRLENLLFEANKKTIDKNTGGLSTLSSLLISKKDASIKYLNIGDSRIYTFSNQYLEQITKDDVLEKGSNIITKAIGDIELDEKCFICYNVNNISDFLICSDGFYNLMENNLAEYFYVLNYERIGNTKKKLLSLQNGKNNDDSSYILIKRNV